MTPIYRIQDLLGRGPFRPGFSHLWSDVDFAPGMKPLPTWMEEFGKDLVKRKGRPGEHFGSATRSLGDLDHWFSPNEQRRLCALRFSIVAIDDYRVLAEFSNQLVFARRFPLHSHIDFVPWPWERTP